MNQNAHIVIKENELQNVICNMEVMLPLIQCVCMSENINPVADGKGQGSSAVFQLVLDI